MLSFCFVLLYIQYISLSEAYTGHDIEYTWPTAEDYCLTNHRSHLATIDNSAQNIEVTNICSNLGNVNCWIGMNKFEGTTEYIWSNTLNTASYTNWDSGQPDQRLTVSQCGQTNNLGIWSSQFCVNAIPAEAFICDPDDTAVEASSKGYIGHNIKYTSHNIKLSWYAAEDYCLYHHQSHLATINNEAENMQVTNMCRNYTSLNCWFGLNKFLGSTQYIWSSTSNIPIYTFWYVGEPETHITVSYCSKINSFGNGGPGRYWMTQFCSNAIPAESFICDPQNTAITASSKEYISHNIKLSWYAAEDYCLYYHQSHLATIDNEAENTKITNMCRDLGSVDCWIGMNSFLGTSEYIWSSTSNTAIYTNWFVENE
eukprot:280438_1